MKKTKLVLILLLVVAMSVTVAFAADMASADASMSAGTETGVAVGGGSVAVGGGSGGGGSSSSATSGTCGDNATWQLSSDGTLTVSGTGAIDSYALAYDITDATKVVIEEGITEIGYGAFSSCNKITEVVLPESLTVIGEQAFLNCSSLTKLTMAGNVSTISSNAFAYCGFETFVIPDGVTTLDSYAVMGDNLRIVYVPDSVTYMDSYAFGYSGVVLVGSEGSYAQQFASNNSYNGISFITPENSVSTGYAGSDITYEIDVIKGTLTFSGSGAMKNFAYYDTPWWNQAGCISKVVIDEDITTIGDYAFYRFTKLTSLSIGSNITEVGSYAFYECVLLTDIGVLSNATHFGEYAFAYCNNLSRFPGGESLKYIGSYAFQSVRFAYDVVLPDSLVTVKSYAFSSAAVNNLHIGKNLGSDFASTLMNLTVSGNITLSEENTYFTLADNVLMNSDKTAIVKAGGISGAYTVPDGVKKIAARAFYGTGITGVTLPDGLQEIGEMAFNSCSYLYEVTIPASVTVIGERAFRDSTSFTINGYTNSIAEKHASDRGYTFVSLGEAPVKDIRVTNSYELLDALNNTVSANIVLADGVYAFEKTVKLNGAYNLTISAENPGKAEILTFDGYNPVIKIEDSKNVTINGLILGHFSLVYREGNCGNGSSSGGYVIHSTGSENILIDYCDLYGCGTYAACLSYTGSMELRNSILRDCSEGIIYAYGYDYYVDDNTVTIDNCIVSGNAYLEEYATANPGIINDSNPVEVSNTTFINNFSTVFSTNELDYMYGCSYADNAWDGYVPQEYGVCLNGITWSIVDVTDDNGNTEKVLRIGYPIQSGDVSITSATGAVLPYSTSSVPWKGKHYDRIELAEGITYDDSIAHSACGYDMRWTLDKDTGVLDITGSGDMFEYHHWQYLEEYIKTIYASDDITYIYRYALTGTPFFYSTGERIDGLLYIGRHLVDANVESGTVTVREGTLTIAENVFDNCGMTKIVIPSSVTVIPDSAFAYCSKLEEVVLPDTITEIGNYAFQRCSSLENLVIPASVTKIGSGAFAGCLLITDITLPDGVTELGDALFDGCSNLKSVKLPEGITEIGQNMFWGCSSLASVDIPSTVTRLSYGAFRECTSLTEFVIPEGITYVDSSVFESCTSLTKLTIPATVTEFYYCLYNCTSLTEIVYNGTKAQWDNMAYNSLADASALEYKITGKDFTLAPLEVEYRYVSYSDSIEITGAKSFVTDLVIPAEIDGYPVKAIAYDAFTDNANIKSVTLPEGLEYVTADAFVGTAFYNNKENWQDGILYIGSYLLCADPALKGQVSIADGTKTICEFAFDRCSDITSVSIPQSVNLIMSGAFSNCTKLENVVFPDSITEIYGEMFYNCTSLKTVTLPANITSFEPYLFYGCSALENVYVVESNAYYCSVDGVLCTDDKTTLVYYPSGRLSNAAIPAGITTVANGAFLYSSVENISIPVSVTDIEAGAFQNCYALSEVRYGGTEEQWNAVNIGEYGNDSLYNAKIIGSDFVIEPDILKIELNGDGTASVVGCVTYVNEITIPAEYEGAAVTQINNWAFEGCTSLESIKVDSNNSYFKSVDGILFNADMTTLIKYPAKKSGAVYTVPDSVTGFAYYAFEGSSLEEITVSPNVACVENWIFEKCTKLKKVVLQEGTTTIGYSLFEGCTALETVVIPESVTTIDRFAFMSCDSLKTIEYAGSKADWNNIFINDYNDALENVTIVYGKTVPAVEYTEFAAVEYSPEDETAFVCVYVDGVNEAFTMLAAIYDENNRLVATEKALVTTDQSGSVVAVELTSVQMDVIPMLKLFFWDDENLSIPVGKPIVLEDVIL